MSIVIYENVCKVSYDGAITSCSVPPLANSYFVKY